MKQKIFIIWQFLKEVVEKWSDDKVPRLGAALSFYTIFSLTPLLIISIYIIGFFYNPGDASGEIFLQVKEMVGSEGALLIQTAVQNANQTETGTIAGIISIVTLIFGATAVFIQLQESLNTIWRVQHRKVKGIKGLVKDRIISFIMVLCTGVIILFFLIITSIVALLTNYVGSLHAFILEIINLLISLLIIFFLFSLIYKILPDISLSWKDVRMGALVTSILFVLGKNLVGIYLGKTSYASIYGAAGSLAVLLIWIYYSSQIIFLGAEFTYIYSIKSGKIHPPEQISA